MRRSRETNGLATSILTGVLMFVIMISRRVWYPSSDHVPYWLIGLVAGASSIVARWFVRAVAGPRM